MLNDKVKIEEGSYYHLYNRGNNRGEIFFEPKNYYYFLRQFKKHMETSCDVHAYCLMPNHFHMFVSVLDKKAFHKGIKNFFICYSKSINKQYDRVGSLFQGRYKAIEIKTDNYFTRIITYIHQNPLAAGLVKRLEDYKYSSYRKYFYKEPSLIKQKETLEWFNGLENLITEHQQVENILTYSKTS